MFRPPTDGYVDRSINETLDDLLFPRKAAIFPYVAKQELVDQSLKIDIKEGDVVTIAVDESPREGKVGLVEYEGDMHLAIWFRPRGKKRWYIRTNERHGPVSQDMTLKGMLHFVIKNQIKD